MGDGKNYSWNAWVDGLAVSHGVFIRTVGGWWRIGSPQNLGLLKMISFYFIFSVGYTITIWDLHGSTVYMFKRCLKQIQEKYRQLVLYWKKTLGNTYHFDPQLEPHDS